MYDNTRSTTIVNDRESDRMIKMNNWMIDYPYYIIITAKPVTITSELPIEGNANGFYNHITRLLNDMSGRDIKSTLDSFKRVELSAVFYDADLIKEIRYEISAKDFLSILADIIIKYEGKIKTKPKSEVVVKPTWREEDLVPNPKI